MNPKKVGEVWILAKKLSGVCLDLLIVTILGVGSAYVASKVF